MVKSLFNTKQKQIKLTQRAREIQRRQYCEGDCTCKKCHPPKNYGDKLCDFCLFERWKTPKQKVEKIKSCPDYTCKGIPSPKVLTTMNKKNKQQSNWEKEFEKNFTTLNDFGRPELNRFFIKDYKKDSVITSLDEDAYLAIKRFISAQIQQAREETLKEVIEKIDEVYGQEKGIHHWLDLREELTKA